MDALRKQAKRWLRALRGKDAESRARLERAYPAAPPAPTLRDVQHALAREYGYENWTALKRAHEDVQRAGDADTPQAYAQLVRDLLVAFNDRQATALQAFNARYSLGFTLDDLDALVWGMVYAFRQRSFRSPERYLLPAEAQMIIAQLQGYPGWEALTDTGPARSARVPAYEIDDHENRIAPRRVMTGAEWDELVDVVRLRRITTVDGGGQISDALMPRITRCDRVTRLVLAGSHRLTDEGLKHLAEMPQLQHLELSAYPGGRFTDAGLAVLSQLTSLRTFEMTWQRGISDAGLRHLRACERLERVNVMGSTSGDGLIDAMAGKQSRYVAALPLKYYYAGLTQITDASLEILGRMDTLEEIEFYECQRITDAGLPALAALPRLRELSVAGSKGVTHAGTRVFPARVRVRYST